MEDQILALEVADMWEFEDVRSRLISILQAKSMSLIDKICLGRRVRVASWIIEGYEGLCTQYESLPKEVGEKLGWKSHLEVAKLRENTTLWTPRGLRATIQDRFKDELMLDPTYKTP